MTSVVPGVLGAPELLNLLVIAATQLAIPALVAVAVFNYFDRGRGDRSQISALE